MQNEQQIRRENWDKRIEETQVKVLRERNRKLRESIMEKVKRILKGE